MAIAWPTRKMSNLDALLRELRGAGETVDRALLDRIVALGEAAVAPLIEIAVDERLHKAKSTDPKAWAPIHAIQLLGELEAAEAVDRLLTLFDRLDDALAWALPEAFGRIGEAAFAPTRSLLFDRDQDVWGRVRAADALSKIGQYHPALRGPVVSALVARLDPAESLSPEDEILNGFVISGLLDVEATEAAPAIRRAFAEDRVDTSVVNLDKALKRLGLPREPRPARENQPGMRLRLHCTACHYDREHNVGTVYCDVSTHERRERGEKMPHDRFVITRPITCPKCGAKNQYELTAHALLTITATMLRRMAVLEQDAPAGEELDEELAFGRFRAGGREMHPLEAVDMYRRQIAARPGDPDVRIRYANVLRSVGRHDEAETEYRTALEVKPAAIEAWFNLGYIAAEAGDLQKAQARYQRVLDLAGASDLPGPKRDEFVAGARSALAHPFASIKVGPPTDQTSISRRHLAQTGHASHQPARREQPKIGRNEPCPCGSGRKYKKCHGG